MPLTPADINSVEFRRPALGRRGYDDVAVDAFLDRAAQEFARLTAENRALRERLDHSAVGVPASPSRPDSHFSPADAVTGHAGNQRRDEEVSEAQRASDDAAGRRHGGGDVAGRRQGDQELPGHEDRGQPTAEPSVRGPRRSARAGQVAALAARLERLKAEQERAEQQARDLRDELERARAPRKTAGDPEDRVVALARRTADEYLRDAGDTARNLLVTARTKADRLTSDAALRASTIDSDARHRHTEAVSDLVGQRAAALAEIDRLTEVARTCRDRLEFQVTRRLRDLGGA